MHKTEIFRYIHGKITEIEKSAFEKQYKNNPEFRKQVNEICQREGILEILTTILLAPSEEDITQFGPTEEQKDRIWKKLPQKNEKKKP